MLERYLRTVVRHRFVVMLLVALATLLLAAQTRQLSVVVDPDDILPQSHPLISTTNRIEALFGNRFTVVIGVHAVQGTVYDNGVTERVRALTEDVLRLPGAVRANVNSIAARKAKSITGNDEGMVVKPLLGSGPAALEHLRAGLAANPVYADILVSKDARTAQIVAEFQKIPGGFAAIERNVREAVAKHADPSVQIDLGGQPVFLALLEKFSERMAFLFPLAVLVIGLIHYEAFRTVQALVLPLVTALLAVVWALGMLGLSRQPFDVFNASTPILILAIAAGHAVQILKRYYEEYAALEREDPAQDPRARSREAVVRSLSRIGPVMLVAGGVAAAGFVSLVVFEIKSIQVFGLFTAAGIVSALVLELTLIPALRSVLPAPGRRELERERMPTLWSRITDRAFALAWQRPGRVFAVAAIAAIVAVAGATQLRVDNSQKGYFYGSLPAKLQDSRLNERMAGTNTLYVLVKGREDDALKQPAVLEGMQRLQEMLDADPMVGRSLSLADFVRRMHRAMNGDAPAFDAIPDSAELVAQYLLLYASSGDPGDFDSYVDTNYRNGLVTVFVKTDATAYSEDLIRRVREFSRTAFGPEVEIAVGGGTAATVALTETMVQEKALNILQIMAAVLLITSVVFRSLAAGLLVLMPVLAAVLANFGIMGLTGIPLQIGTALVSAMAVGIGADYGIYMIYRMREELRRGGDEERALRKAFGAAGKATLFVSTAVAGGFGLLMLSWGFWIHFYMGFLIATAMLVSSIAALTLLPALVFRLRPRFVFGAAAGGAPSAARRATALLVLAAFGATAVPVPEAHAQALSAEEIATRNFAVAKVADSVTEATFRLVSPNGQERVRKTQGRSKLKAGTLDNRSLVRFLSPADVRGTVTLTIENSEPGRDDDIWIYLPALKKVRRLVSSNKKDSFVGTDFSYGDVIGYRVADWTHRIVREEKQDGFDCWVIESTPKTAQVREDSGYSKRVGWIRKDNFAAVRAESFDMSGTLAKVILLRDHRNVDPKNGKWVAMKLEAQNVLENRRTLIEFERYEVNQGVPEDTFTARALERES
jgi:predicted RND superfamily exporter protein/outer membrane lipoprotein-sorting protein